jgi:hypothetical protein
VNVVKATTFDVTPAGIETPTDATAVGNKSFCEISSQVFYLFHEVL